MPGWNASDDEVGAGAIAVDFADDVDPAYVAEVGRRAGFTDASHLTRVIRSRTGRTPSQIRRPEMSQSNKKRRNETRDD